MPPLCWSLGVGLPRAAGASGPSNGATGQVGANIVVLRNANAMIDIRMMEATRSTEEEIGASREIDGILLSKKMAGAAIPLHPMDMIIASSVWVKRFFHFTFIKHCIHGTKAGTLLLTRT